MKKKFKILFIHVNNNIFRIILQPSKKTSNSLNSPQARIKIDVQLSDALLRKHFYMRYSNDGNDIVDKIINQAEKEKKKGRYRRAQTRQVTFHSIEIPVFLNFFRQAEEIQMKTAQRNRSLESVDLFRKAQVVF